VRTFRGAARRLRGNATQYESREIASDRRNHFPSDFDRRNIRKTDHTRSRLSKSDTVFTGVE